MRDLWTSARSLWVKFCGIADEYKMLRDRWLYLYSKNKLPVLPYLRAKNPDEEEQTFDLLDNHVKELETKFGELGFERNKMESYNDFRQETSGTDRVDIVDKLKLIEDYVYDLANFVGLLKFAFFQRTVSSEIPHVASGMPHSPERTIGNELFYLAADNVAKRYYECLNIPYGKWDGFITFTPPIEEGYFYGAFCYPSPYLELFHISMSEEAKYFVGSYLALAHEFGHAVLKRRIKRGDIAILEDASWANIILNTVYRQITGYVLSDLKLCRSCPIYRLFFERTEFLRIVLHPDIIADIIGVYIGGINTLHSLIDFTYSILSDYVSSIPILLRIATATFYFRLSGDSMFDVSSLWRRFEEKIMRDAEKIRESYNQPCTEFFNCITKIGSQWAVIIHKFNKDFGRLIFEGFEEYIEDLVYQFNPFRASIDTERILNENLEGILNIIFPEESVELLLEVIDERGNLFSTIIKDKFKIRKEEENRIVEALVGGTPVPEEDPRHILHCYYEAYKQSEGEERPNYAATIYSLAFNTYNNKKKKRKS